MLQKTAVPGMIPKNVPMTKVRAGTPKSAGTRFTSQNGKMGISLRTRRYERALSWKPFSIFLPVSPIFSWQKSNST